MCQVFFLYYLLHLDCKFKAEKIALATIAGMALSIATPTLALDYLANTKSGKFHYTDCRTIKHPDVLHFVHYSSRDEAIADGYEPCGVCEP